MARRVGLYARSFSATRAYTTIIFQNAKLVKGSKFTGLRG